ncbi:hypothetical protein [Tolypothrix sp. FACHB-123]|nr:hypothetical protein [Tolypothrix sp. FACHB-123]
MLRNLTNFLFRVTAGLAKKTSQAIATLQVHTFMVNDPSPATRT